MDREVQPPDREGAALSERSAAGNDAAGFVHQLRGNGDVVVLHHGRRAATLRGEKAAAFLRSLVTSTPAEAQRLMARVTGNYRRGNERTAAHHPRNAGG